MKSDKTDMKLAKYPRRYKFAKGMLWLYLSIAIFVLLYTFYRSEITHGGNRYHLYVKYYMVAFAGILFCSLVLWLKDESRLNVVMVMTSVISSLYLMEFFLYIAVASGSHYDTRSPYEVYLDYKNDGVDAVPSVRPNLFVSTNGVYVNKSKSLFPLAGVSGKTTIYCNEGGEYLIYQSDKYGFHNPNWVWDKGQVSWVLVGDSFTQGACVKTGEEIAGKIRVQRKHSVINLGLGGNGPLMELAGLKEYAELMKPEVVLWLYYEGNDLTSNLQRDLSSPLLMNYLSDGYSQNLPNRQIEIDLKLKQYIALAELSHEGILVQLEKSIQKMRGLRLLRLRQRIGVDRRDIEFEVSPRFSEIMEKAKKRTTAWGGKLYFVYLPEYARYTLKEEDQSGFRRRAEVLSIVRGIDIPVIDIHQKVFEKHPDPFSLFPFRSEGHYNAAGYSLVAQAIMKGVAKAVEISQE